jgi:serine/threonine protein phosphatase PrpC
LRRAILRSPVLMHGHPQIPATVHDDVLLAPERTRLAALRTRHQGITDCGLCRMRNEDAFLIDERLGLFIVCDGVGGRAHGEIAAAETVTSVWEHVRREVALYQPGVDRGGWLGAVLRAALQHASRVVYELAAADRRFTGMSTTASALLVAGGLAVIGHVGDSRVYHARGGAVRQLTEDHTLRNLQVHQGLVSPEQARGRKSPIIRVVGVRDRVEVDTVVVPLAAGDRLLLCTDGLHAYLEDDATLRQLFRLDIQEAGAAAVAHAHRCGGKDNITAVFVEVIANS